MNNDETNYLKKMILVCNEYANIEFDKIFIYLSNEHGVEFCDFFFKIGKKILEKNEVDKILKLDMKKSIDKQEIYIDKIFKIFKQFLSCLASLKKTVPTEVRVTYSPNKDDFKVKYEYNPVYENRDICASEIFDEWISVEK